MLVGCGTDDTIKANSTYLGLLEDGKTKITLYMDEEGCEWLITSTDEYGAASMITPRTHKVNDTVEQICRPKIRD
ncbi:hypothetical protein CEW46_32550 [Bacillus cereus]|nr:hypothetical protein CEW46_32550 [Bacillus cereus]